MKKGNSIYEKVDFLMSCIESLEKENAVLRTKVDQLTARLSKYETPKNIGNSNKPLSSDYPRAPKTSSLRSPLGNKPGGQPGHEGSTLRMVSFPDIIEGHQSSYSPKCGRDISSLSAELVGKRQVIDIPPIRPVVTEHRIYKHACTCGRGLVDLLLVSYSKSQMQ